MTVKASGCGWDWLGLLDGNEVAEFVSCPRPLVWATLELRKLAAQCLSESFKATSISKGGKQCYWVEDDQSKPSPQETRAFPEQVAEITACHYVNFSTIF